MAGENRTAADPVALPGEVPALFARLAEEPWRFDFFQALRRIECLRGDLPRWGESRHAGEDPVRFAQEPSLAFAPSTLASFEPGDGERRARLQVRFFGLFGPQGPLPLHLTEYARDRLRNSGDPTFTRFADLFHHRLLSLYYRAWASARPAVQYDRPESDRFAVYVGSLFGMGLASLRRRDSVLDRARLHFAGSFAAPARNAEGLQGILSGFFEMRVRIEPFIGHWIPLPEGSQGRVGASALGVNTFAGNRVWDCQHKFRIVFGPLSLADFSRLLPGGESLERLAALVCAYVGDELIWDLNLVVKREEVPSIKLGEQGRLGWTTWLLSRPVDQDVRDLVLNPVAGAA